MPVSAVIALLLVYGTFGIVCALIGARLTYCRQQELPPPNPLPATDPAVRVSGGDDGTPEMIEPKRSKL